MSFNGYKEVIEEGDMVILYLTINQIYCIKAEKRILSKKGIEIENVFQTPYGALKCGELIGKNYGTKITLTKGWGYILQPNPDLWTATLPHRTQIIYTADISIILFQLELSPGSVVIESGTGSGSLSHALIRTIKPHGHLYTFDFHESRVNQAELEFKEHGLDSFVTVRNRDVCADGFGDELNNKADAVFLDLPHPWLGIPHALKSLKDEGGRICTFSPCIEQVQKSCLTLSELGFEDIRTIEILQTLNSVQTKSLSVINLDFIKTKKSDNDDKVIPKNDNVIKYSTSVCPKTMAGHTGFLTFATLPPIWARNLQISLYENSK